MSDGIAPKAPPSFSARERMAARPVLFACAHFFVSLLSTSFTLAGAMEGVGLPLLAASLLLGGWSWWKSKGGLLGWAIIVLFAHGYLVKSLLFLWQGSVAFYSPELLWVDSRTIHRASLIACACFAGLLSGAHLGLAWRPRPASKQAEPDLRGVVQKNPWVCLISLTAGYVGVLGASLVFGLAVMGQDAVHLFLRLDWIINRTTRDVLPFGLLVLGWLWDVSGKSRPSFAAWFAFLVTSIINSLLSASKAGPFLCALLLCVCWGLSGRISVGRVSVLVLLAVGGVLLVPVVGVIRSAVSVDGGRDAAFTFMSSEMRWTDIDLGLDATLNMLTLRVTGAEGLWWCVRDEVWPSMPVSLNSFFGSVSTYFTSEIVGVARHGDFRAPGIAATLLLLAGPWWISLVALALGFVLLWMFVRSERLLCSPAAVSLFAVTATLFLMDGTFRLQDLLLAWGLGFGADGLLSLLGVERRENAHARTLALIPEEVPRT